MSLVSNWVNWVDDNIVEGGKAVVGSFLEKAMDAPIGFQAFQDPNRTQTRRRVFMEKYANVAQNIGAGISTAALLTDADNPYLKDGFQLTRGGSIAEGDIGRTFTDYGKVISPAQAIFAGSEAFTFPGIRAAIRGGAQLLGKEVPTGAKKDFNLYDEEQRRVAFDEEVAGKWTTGLADAVITWFADPFLIGSRAARLARTETLDRSVPLGDTDAINKVMTQAGPSAFIDEVLVTDQAGLLKNRVVRLSSDPDFVAGLFGEIDNARFGAKARDVAEDTYRALLGDETALSRLDTLAAASADAIRRAQTNKRFTDNDIKYIADVQFNGDVNAALLARSDLRNKVSEVYKDLVKRDKYLQSAIERARQGVNASPFAGPQAILPSRFGFIERTRATRGRSRANAFLGGPGLRSTSQRGVEGLEWKVEDFQLAPFHRVVRFISWSGLQRPSGIVNYKGFAAAESADELVSFMDSVQPWKGVESAATKRNLINSYLSAQTDVARANAIRRIEDTAIDAVNKKFNLDVPLNALEKQKYKVQGIKVPATLGEALKIDIMLRRENAKGVMRQSNFMVDDVVDPIIATTPELSSQIAETYQMLDIILYQRLAKENLGSIRGLAAKFGDRLLELYKTFDFFWRASVLLRLGYTQRNVGEGLLRSALYHRSFMKLQIEANLTNGAKNIKNNLLTERYERWKIAQQMGMSKPKATLGTYEDMIAWQEDQISIARIALKEKTDTLTTLQKEFKSKKISNKQKNAIKKDIVLLNDEIKTAKQGIVDAENGLSFLSDKIGKLLTKEGSALVKGRLGRKPITISNLTFRGSADGDMGAVGKKLASSARRVKAEVRNPLMQSRSIESYGYGLIRPNEIGYWDALSTSGRQFRNSEVTRRLMLIDTTLGRRHIANEVKKIDQWFKSKDPAAKRERSNTYAALESREALNNYVTKMWQDVQNYFPDPEIRLAMAKESTSLNGYQLRSKMGQRDDLGNIHGELIGPKGNRTTGELLRDSVDTAYKYLGTIPEDVMVRVPFYDNIYKSTIRQGAEALLKREKRTGIKITDREIKQVEFAAHRAALKEVNRNLFTIKRYSNFAAYGSFISPFIQAHLNTFRTWGRLAYENPDLFAPAPVLWRQGTANEFIGKDEDTNELYVTLQVPESWRDNPLFQGVEQVKVALNRFNFILAGQPWYSPGAGPIVQVAASNIINNIPWIDKAIYEKTGRILPVRSFIDKYVLPFGSSTAPGSLDLLLSASLQRIGSIAGAQFGFYTDEFLVRMNNITTIEFQKYRSGLRDTEPTPDEILDRTTNFFFLRLIANLGLPAIPEFKTDYDIYFTKYRELTTQYGYEQGEAMFYDMYPDYFELVTTRFRKNTTGIDPTIEAAARAEKFAPLINKVEQDNPYVSQLITNDVGAELDFDNAAYAWQLKTAVGGTGEVTYRDNIDADTAMKEAKIKSGWVEYNKFSQWLEAEIEASGFETIEDRGAEYLKDARKDFIADLSKNNQAWGIAFSEDYSPKGYRKNIRAINTILTDVEFMNSDIAKDEPAFDYLIDYMDFRDFVVSELERRGTVGGAKSLNAESNDDIRKGIALFISEKKSESPKFSLWYDRYLASDQFERLN